MKQAALTAFLLALFVPALSQAGTFNTGYVVVGANYMYGTMHVRYTADATQYLRAYGYANSTVYFSGRDIASNFFSCAVTPASAIYAAAVDFKNNLRNGSFLYVASDAAGNCTSINFQNASYHMN